MDKEFYNDLSKLILFLQIIIVFIIVVTLLIAINTSIGSKKVCKENNLEFSIYSFNCYNDTKDGIIVYDVERVGTFEFKLNKIPIVPDE